MPFVELIAPALTREECAVSTNSPECQRSVGVTLGCLHPLFRDPRFPSHGSDFNSADLCPPSVQMVLELCSSNRWIFFVSLSCFCHCTMGLSGLFPNYRGGRGAICNCLFTPWASHYPCAERQSSLARVSQPRCVCGMVLTASPVVGIVTFARTDTHPPPGHFLRLTLVMSLAAPGLRCAQGLSVPHTPLRNVG